MRDKKQKHKDSQMSNNVQNEELEISQTGYGLESVTEGTDYMAGDEKNSPNCGGL